MLLGTHLNILMLLCLLAVGDTTCIAALVVLNPSIATAVNVTIVVTSQLIVDATKITTRQVLLLPTFTALEHHLVEHLVILL